MKQTAVIIEGVIIRGLKEIFRSGKLIFYVRRDFIEELVRPSSDLKNDLGFDSLGLVELSLALEEHFEVIIPDDFYEKVETVQDLINLIGLLKPSLIVNH